ncbi:MAG: hypothetical protein V1776_00795 [Candidatus Diapherotrites archaeon]
MGLSLKEQALVKCVHFFENIGFMEWHARVLNTLTTSPISMREIAQETGLFQYHVRGVVQDLLGLGLIEYTRYGLQLVDVEEMILSLVECCEGNRKRHTYDFEAAFEVISPRVVSLKQRYAFDG